MWKRLRQWLGNSDSHTNNEAAPRIEPGLDAPLPVGQADRSPAQLGELGDAYESPLVSSSAVVDLPEAPPQDPIDADGTSLDLPSGLAPLTDALPEASPVSSSQARPQAPLWPDDLWSSPIAAPAAPAAPGESSTADGDAPTVGDADAALLTPPAEADTATPGEPSAEATSPSERIEPVLADIAPVFEVAPISHVLPEITPQPDPSTRQEPDLGSPAAPPDTSRAEPGLDEESPAAPWRDSRLEPGLDGDPDGELDADDAQEKAQAEPSDTPPAAASAPAGAVTPVSAPKAIPTTTAHSRVEPSGPDTLPHRPFAPPTHPAVPPSLLTAPVVPAQVTATAPPPPAVDDEPVLVHVLATMREATPPRFDCLSQQHLQQGDPDMAEHMQGLMQYVQGRNPVEMSQRRHALWRHLQRVHHLWALSIMPAELDALGLWAGVVNAVVALPDGSVRDPKGYVIMAGPGGRDDALARLPHPADALQRKQRTEALLLARGWNTPSSLPPVAGEGEIDLRDAVTVMGRAMAALLVAVRAESLAEGGAKVLTPEKLRHKLPAAFEHLSPHEQLFVNTAAPSDSQVVAMGWRYEALNVLLWALGLVEELSWPDKVCDVAHCVSLLVNVNADPDALVQDSMLRSRTDILDQLDLHLRLHWLLRDAELHSKPGPDISRGVVMERHHALNWLIDFEHAPWDKVSTAT